MKFLLFLIAFNSKYFMVLTMNTSEHCYWLSYNQQTQNTANDTCVSMGGYLAEIQDQQEWNLALTYVESGQDDFWIGLEKSGLCGGDDDDDEEGGICIFMWGGGQSLGFSDWASSEPSSSSSVIARESSSYQWDAISSSYSKHYMCETTEVNCQCLGQPVINGSCIYVSHGQHNWFQAQAKCEYYGGSLLEINTPEKKQALQTIWSSLGGTGSSKDYWIGLHDMCENSEYFWVSKKDLSYTDWDVSPTKRCGYLKTDQNLAWDTDHCNVPREFLCEIPTSTAVNDTTPSLLEEVFDCACETGYEPNSGKCLWVSIWKGTWAESKDMCELVGGVLLVANTEEVFDFLKTETLLDININSFIWIGLEWNNYYSTWRWSTGENLNWTDWYVGEPSYHTNRCGRIDRDHDYKIYSKYCSEDRHFICEFQHEPAEETTTAVITTPVTTQQTTTEPSTDRESTANKEMTTIVTTASKILTTTVGLLTAKETTSTTLPTSEVESTTSTTISSSDTTTEETTDTTTEETTNIVSASYTYNETTHFTTSVSFKKSETFDVGELVRSMVVLSFDREDTPESDNRISARVIGYVAIIFLVSEALVFLIMDAHLLYNHLVLGVRRDNKKRKNKFRYNGRSKIHLY